MRIRVATEVAKPVSAVKAGFTEDLFLKLNPPFPRVKLLRFDGSLKGDFVALELNFLIAKQKWISEITFDKETEQSFEFIDEGVMLPFPFSSWKHHHKLVSKGKGCEIIDDIEYQAGNKLMTVLLYPLLVLQFLYRKPVYRRIFQ
ncbi:SRPBCC family protein [Roseivirga sp.]|uniref:SRPBCC family protein n=1 Tax=Roseivirga sp. TaxID=1964215 RepID=UPI003B8B338D